LPEWLSTGRGRRGAKYHGHGQIVVSTCHKSKGPSQVGMDSWETKACLDVGHSQKDGSGRMADLRVIDVNIQLNFDVAKSYGSLRRYRGDLVHYNSHGIKHC
jgi:hypothetical protein